MKQSAPSGAGQAYPWDAVTGRDTPAAPATSAGGRGSRASLHVVLAGLLAVAAVGYTTLLRPDPPVRQPVLVEDLSVAHLSGRRLAVTVTVLNEHREAKTARVWWLLAVPGNGPEWDRRAYRSSVRSLELMPGDEADLMWEEEAQVPEGLYAVSAWVHVEGANGFTHEDGHVGADIDVGPDTDAPPGESLLRSGPPRFGVEVTSVAAPTVVPAKPTRPQAPRPSAAATAVVTNPTGQTQRGLVRWGVFSIVENVPIDWWRQPAAWWGEPKAVDLAPGETKEVALGDLGVTEPGRYGVRVMLDTTAREAGGPLDDVAVPVAVDVLAAGQPG
ncbi:MAG: hypothetical protein QOJ69_557 [Actinomycetota bacterium]|nr:hypothetical protein [Actinomycetota bacterium]